MLNSQLSLELWVNFEQKIISFRRIEGWEQFRFENQDTLLEQLDLFARQGFRFQ